MIHVEIDHRVPILGQRVPNGDIPAGWHRFWALFWNRVRVFAERWAGHHAICALMRDNPLSIHEAVQVASLSGRFKDTRGSMMLPPAAPYLERSSEQQSLERLARLTASGRSKRYAVGRRVYTMYDSEETTSEK